MGEISLALLGAVRELSTPEVAPTLLELASHAQVGYGAAHATLKNLHRHKRVRIVRTRLVGYRNRPVAEYALPASEPADEGTGFVDLGDVLRAWG